jgi:outer membrane protein assembly factor BamE (lipoprotein component of BamABCDE complex)
MRFITIIVLALGLILLDSCVYEPIHQGNRLDQEKVFQIKKGDTKFHVEQILGSPMLHSTLHPNRVTYYEEYEDEESGNVIKRGVEIIYDDALRVTQIKYFGLEKPKLK